MRIKNILASVATLCLLGTMGACSILSGGSSGSGNDNNTPRPADSSVTASSTLNAFQLHLGDCLNSAAINGNFTSVPATACTEAHDSEVISIFNVTDATFDQDSIDTEAQTQCEQAMTTYVGPNYDSVTPALEASWFTPTSQSWAQGDREVDCLAVTSDGSTSLTSSVKGMGN